MGIYTHPMLPVETSCVCTTLRMATRSVTGLRRLLAISCQLPCFQLPATSKPVGICVRVYPLGVHEPGLPRVGTPSWTGSSADQAR